MIKTLVKRTVFSVQWAGSHCVIEPGNLELLAAKEQLNRHMQLCSYQGNLGLEDYSRVVDRHQLSYHMTQYCCHVSYQRPPPQSD